MQAREERDDQRRVHAVRRRADGHGDGAGAVLRGRVRHARAGAPGREHKLTFHARPERRVALRSALRTQGVRHAREGILVDNAAARILRQVPSRLRRLPTRARARPDAG